MSEDHEVPVGKTAATREWENEGGSVKPVPAPELPEGITAVTITQYHVGQYRYSSLDDALAEHRRQSDAG